MKVEFWSRDPGEHKLIFTVDMASVPREGESVSITEDGKPHGVHAVSYVVDAAKQKAIVLLRP